MPRKKRDAPPPEVLPVSLAAIAVGYGLPPPIPEHVFRKGRKWAFDLTWAPWLVALEKQGATWQEGRHTRGQGYEDDRVKIAEAQLSGWLVIEATADMLKDGLAWSLVRRALEARGWRGDRKE